MQTNYLNVLIAVFVAIWLVGLVTSIVMYSNRKPGTPFLTDLMFRPDRLNYRGLKARALERQFCQPLTGIPQSKADCDEPTS